MEVVLKLNARLQPMHRHELEDAIQGVLEKEQMGEVTRGWYGSKSRRRDCKL